MSGTAKVGTAEIGTAPAGTAPVTRIAMWSGPRTLSTALMRSFENRADTVVVDEPLYGYYLATTGISHPGREEIMASMATGWPEVLQQLASGQPPAGKTVFYAKHMTHHLLPEIDRELLGGMRHAFLIRDPRRLLASYAKVRATPTLADLGLEQQVEIFQRFGGPVIDAADLAAGPQVMLEALCEALSIPFDPAMLRWPAGPRPTDGVWAKYWYDNVWASTGFRSGPRAGAGIASQTSAGARTSEEIPAAADASLLPPELEPLAALCQPFYAELASHRLAP
jgi:Sulfotransferase domain